MPLMILSQCCLAVFQGNMCINPAAFAETLSPPAVPYDSDGSPRKVPDLCLICQICPCTVVRSCDDSPWHATYHVACKLAMLLNHIGILSADTACKSQVQS